MLVEEIALTPVLGQVTVRKSSPNAYRASFTYVMLGEKRYADVLIYGDKPSMACVASELAHLGFAVVKGEILIQ